VQPGISEPTTAPLSNSINQTTCKPTHSSLVSQYGRQLQEINESKYNKQYIKMPAVKVTIKQIRDANFQECSLQHLAVIPKGSVSTNMAACM
jgi:hypothetical protein